ncbi:MAG TPA: GNAT family N-acetyltransferase [Chloroflexia bacterium]|nr:GNAT family N-acetyltransferase [Chloroflexia bacterium]
MPLSVRRLGPGDEHILSLLATEDADFDLADRGAPLDPLDAEAAARYLANPVVLHWVAMEGDGVVGTLYCIHLPLRSGAGSEVLLYEIGVRTAWRRRGIGRALMGAMAEWMDRNGVTEAWVLADNPEAVAFYRACGFATADDEMAVYMTRTVGAG